MRFRPRRSGRFVPVELDAVGVPEAVHEPIAPERVVDPA
jgi:hypothetical protein